MRLEYWFPVLTLIVGWSLNELSHVFRLRREERKPFAQAIADLLEIRHSIRVVSVAITEFKKRFPIPPDAELALRRFFQDFITQNETLRERYNETVSLIASVDPILAFHLRSKDEFTPFLRRLRPLIDSDYQAKPFAAQIEDRLSGAFVDHLERSIIEVAKAHSIMTWWRVRRFLSKRQEIPKEFDEVMSLVQPRAEVKS
jgi:hypothetical protein